MSWHLDVRLIFGIETDSRLASFGGAPACWTAYASIITGSTDDPTYIMPVAQ